MGTSAVPVRVWDRAGEPGGPGEVWLWRSLESGPGRLSIPAYLETNAERLRARYLAFVHDLGQSVVAGRRIVDHLALDEDFSFWWTTRIAEKSPFKSPGIDASLRLLALEELLREKRPAALTLAGGDEDLAEAMAALCANLGVGFSVEPEGGRQRPESLLPLPLRGFLSLAARVGRRQELVRRRRRSAPKWFSGEGSVFFCSFFAHVDREAGEKGEFNSRYWGPLPARLRDAGARVNWLHHFLAEDGSDSPEARTGGAWLERFGSDAERQGVHAFVDAYAGLGVALRAARHFFRLLAARRRLSGVSSAFKPRGSAAWLWPVLRGDWDESLCGPAAAAACLWVELFDAAIGQLPHQETGLYLCENQAWEPALLHAWRRHGHGRIIGYAHATVPFWHLYYLDDPRSFQTVPPRPAPHLLAVNGPAAMRIFAGAGHPAGILVEVEALRYLGLSAAASGARDGVLVLGDVIAESMESLLSNLQKARPLLPADLRLALKPHPLYPVDVSSYAGLRMEIETAPLDSLLGRFRAAVSANSTSAALDAHLAGLPVVVALNGADLNLSPLRGEPGARFAGTPEELARELNEALRTGGDSVRGDFFFLDPDLPRWTALLKELRLRESGAKS